MIEQSAPEHRELGGFLPSFAFVFRDEYARFGSFHMVELGTKKCACHISTVGHMQIDGLPMYLPDSAGNGL